MRGLYAVAHGRAVAARALAEAPDPTRPAPAEVALELRAMGVTDATPENVRDLATLLGLPLAPLPPDA